MWVLVMFDLPTESQLQRKRAAQFRKKLLNDGFMMTQFSVYSRPCATNEHGEKHLERVQDWIPPEGCVRMLSLTSLQWSKMRSFFGKTEKELEKENDQLTFF